jgi:hypothetical protein
MACWPANIVGAFFVALLIFDTMMGEYDDLLPHSAAGIVFTFIFWLVCYVLGESVSAAVLVVPSVVLIVFVFSIWFVGKSMKQRGYCMSKGQGDQCLPPPAKPKCPPPKPKCPPPAASLKPKCPPPKPKCI